MELRHLEPFFCIGTNFKLHCCMIILNIIFASINANFGPKNVTLLKMRNTNTI